MALPFTLKKYPKAKTRIMETLWITLEKLVQIFMFGLRIIPGLPFVRCLLVSSSHLGNVPWLKGKMITYNPNLQ
jgi:hypothetical protein